MPTSITPNLWFDGNAEEAADFYVSVFKNSRIVAKALYPENSPGEAGTVMTVEWELDGNRFVGINGGSQFTFSEAISLLIACADQEEIDYYWDALSAGGSEGLVEEDLETTEVGVCLDFGHAHMDGDLLDAIETVSGHLITTHVHDNRGRTDDHLVPFDGTIDWPAAMTAIQKVGYDQTLLFEIAAHGSPKQTLVKAQKARQRLERLLAD